MYRKSTTRSRALDAKTIGEILLRSKTSGHAIRSLYLALKANDKKMTMRRICEGIGIASTGYFSDTMNGNKVLNERYATKFNAIVGMSRRQSQVLRLLIKQDKCRDGSERRALQKKLGIAKSQLAARSTAYPSDPGNAKELISAIETFCALGLFENRATIGQLSRLFGSSDRIKRDMANLKSWGFVEELDGAFTPADQRFVLTRTKDSEPINYIRESLRQILRGLDTWYERKSEAYYESGFISVDRRGYQRLLKEAQENYSRACAEYESGKADMVISYNIQIHPTVRNDIVAYS